MKVNEVVGGTSSNAITALAQIEIEIEIVLSAEQSLLSVLSSSKPRTSPVTTKCPGDLSQDGEGG